MYDQVICHGTVNFRMKNDLDEHGSQQNVHILGSLALTYSDANLDE